MPSCTITTNTPDRAGDRVLASGARLANFWRNPAVLFGHDYHTLPVGKATALTPTDTSLRASWRWLANDPFADRVRNAWDQGVLRATSIGFLPITSVPNGKGYDHTAWELLEFSIVPVPANPEAVRTLKALGLGDYMAKNQHTIDVDIARLNQTIRSVVQREVSKALTRRGAGEDALVLEIADDPAAVRAHRAAVTEQRLIGAAKAQDVAIAGIRAGLTALRAHGDINGTTPWERVSDYLPHDLKQLPAPLVPIAQALCRAGGIPLL
jgi:HK97 family phage prohead protease